jgi:UDP-glucose 4-epimerase
VNWLLTGGAGYIGAHVVRGMRAAGLGVVVVDDLSTGLRSRLATDVPLVRANVRDADAVRDAIERHRVVGVVHLAARKGVVESTVDPLLYYHDNIDGLRAVLVAAVAGGARHFVYSSSAAVYGTPADAGPVHETSRTSPGNAYGRTKLVGEWMVADAARACSLTYAALRYFNVAGAGEPDLADVGEVNLLPRLLRAAAEDSPATVYGTDYPTRDGSCVRDYVHVGDIADAHVTVAQALAAGEVENEIFNVGRGVGVSVLEMLGAVRGVTGLPLRYRVAPRRPGDAPSAVGSTERIEMRLGWQAQRDLTDIVTSAWQALLHSGSLGRQSQEASCSPSSAAGVA